MCWLGDVSQGLWDWEAPSALRSVQSEDGAWSFPVPMSTDHPIGWIVMGMPSPPRGLVGLHRTEWQVADSEVHPSTTLKLWAITFQGFSWLMRSAPSPSGWGSLSLCASLSDRSLLFPVLFNSTASAPPTTTPTQSCLPGLPRTLGLCHLQPRHAGSCLFPVLRSPRQFI